MGGYVLVLVDETGMELDHKILLHIVVAYGAEVTGLDGLSFQKITGTYYVFKADKPL